MNSPRPSRLRWLPWALALAALLLASRLAGGLLQREPLPYSEFLQALEAGRLADLTVLPDRIEGTLQTASGPTPFVSLRVDPALAEELAGRGVRFGGAPAATVWGTLLSWIVPPLLLVTLWSVVLRRMGGADGVRGGLGGVLSIGRSRARLYAETEVKVTFDDVAGADEAKAELEEVVEFLRDPKAHARLGARMPKGILLVGPPGTGKTLLARAVAGQAGVPFFSINGSEFVEMFVGVGAARVRDLFQQARDSAPCIVFIDEIDALGRARGPLALGGQDEKEQTLNQLLAEVDGFDASAGVVLLAATNRPEILDPALLRAGRFDRQVLLDRPDRRGRVQILQVHLRRVRLAADVDPEQLAALTPGFTGADLANLVNEGALLATRRNGESVTMDDFAAAVERIVAGLERRNRLPNAQERRTIAVREMGHVLVALALPGTDRVHKVSIIPRGIGALGYTLQRPTEDRYLMTRAELESRMAVLMGGRAAEALLLGEPSTGAEDDVARATDIAPSMVMRFGMDERLGAVAYERAPSPLLPVAGEAPAAAREFSETTGSDIDIAIRGLTAAALARATQVLAAHRELLDEASRLLLARETLQEHDVRALAARMAAPLALAR